MGLCSRTHRTYTKTSSLRSKKGETAVFLLHWVHDTRMTHMCWCNTIFLLKEVREERSRSISDAKNLSPFFEWKKGNPHLFSIFQKDVQAWCRMSIECANEFPDKNYFFELALSVPCRHCFHCSLRAAAAPIDKYALLIPRLPPSTEFPQFSYFVNDISRN